ncbi:MAG: mycothiol synthase [Motilibacteraceae bacterium]
MSEATATGRAGQPLPPVRVQVAQRLDAAVLAAVTDLVEAATDVDGVSPLSEHVALHLRHGGDVGALNVLVWADAGGEGGRLAAYGHLDVTDQVEGASAELVVAPDLRRRGYGRVLVQTLLAHAPGGRLRLWAHGRGSAAGELSRAMGFAVVRELWQMRRTLHTALPAPALPDDVTVRTFRPGEDDEAWVGLNARAFADHPEQGSWTARDLHRRMAEPWFDPAGFFLAERTTPDGPRLVAFHWTKVHGGAQHHEHGELGPHSHEAHGHDAIGEVYVVGVDPAEQGHGLGRAMTLVGLRHLRHRGLPAAMLYVDADNRSAVAVYTALGFTTWDVDAMFSRPSGEPPESDERDERPDGEGRDGQSGPHR